MRIPSRKILFAFLFISSISAYAGWPTFSVLKPEDINNLATHVGCPADEIRIPIGTKVQIKNNYIPRNQTWYWIYNGSSQCQKIDGSLIYKSYQRIGNRETGGQIITEYGDAKQNLFSFVFTYAPGWDCGPFYGPEPAEITGCAQDMLAYKNLK